MSQKYFAISFPSVELFNTLVCFRTTQFDYRLSIPNSKCGVFQSQELVDHQHEVRAQEALFMFSVTLTLY